MVVSFICSYLRLDGVGQGLTGDKGSVESVYVEFECLAHVLSDKTYDYCISAGCLVICDLIAGILCHYNAVILICYNDLYILGGVPCIIKSEVVLEGYCICAVERSGLICCTGCALVYSRSCDIGIYLVLRKSGAVISSVSAAFARLSRL